MTFLCIAADPATEPATRGSDEIRRGQEMGGTPEERQRKLYEGVVRKVEPEGVGNPRRLSSYLGFFEREFVEDPRQFAISLNVEGNSVMGYVETAEHQKALSLFLQHLKLDNVENRTELLPSGELGEKKFAVVTQRCFLQDRSVGKGEMLTECGVGDSTWLLKDSREGRLLCHGQGGYVGWIDTANVRRIDGNELDQIINAKPTDDRVEKVIAAAKEMMLSSTVGSEAWNSRDLKSRPH